jgi:azurin
VRFEPNPEGLGPLPESEFSGPPESPLLRVIPIVQELGIAGHQCVVTSIEAWSNVFIVRYVESALDEDWSHPDDEKSYLEESLSRGTFATGLLAGAWEASDDTGMIYRRVGAHTSSSGGRREGQITFYPALSTTSKELRFSIGDRSGNLEASAAIVLPSGGSIPQ